MSSEVIVLLRSYNTPLHLDTASSSRALHHSVYTDTRHFYGNSVVSLLSWFFLFGVRVSWESECLIKSFVFSHTMSLSSLTHCLALHQISDPLIDNHTFVFCHLVKFQSLCRSPRPTPPHRHHSPIYHVQTSSQMLYLVMACCHNRAKCWLWQSMLWVTDWFLKVNLHSLLLCQPLLYLTSLKFHSMNISIYVLYCYWQHTAVSGIFVGQLFEIDKYWLESCSMPFNVLN